MHLIIRDFDKIIFDEFVREAVLPGDDGELSVWDFHQPLVTRLKKGEIMVRFNSNTELKTVHINSGIAKFHNNELVILCL